ncbi:hypothetical protein HanRHA438_Chr02g0094751 [Helianthus annuus]|uniref:Uncharacterized protein n=1 Tax=Helianthus annuus TaxID=4232 RepID=A0A251VIR6_HELAN|nr:hypothetical protein HanXRQr2_Chr02g0083371 [Helianthus annuus]KAJ0620049.1 hypothetical protein HanHA89_Chr02g0078081 [Helianthus annuus]KAJ0778507.1 hypothetical protein HanLR1_Chr02g0072451 [Helianthus annuus]KAJ0941460.1 hypothetical protein HanRHA438_Chr02g0094751 [Helianthus annuus]
MTGICRSSILPLFHPTTENTQPHLLRFLLLSAHFACSMNVFTYSCLRREKIGSVE